MTTVTDIERVPMSAEQKELRDSILRFVSWLDGYGEVSWDHQSYYVGPYGRAAKRLYYKKPALGILAVAPMIFSEAFVPSARKLFWKAQRLPIADAHYAMGFAMLARTLEEEKYYRRALHFLDVLLETRVPGYENYGWGYPFDWLTKYKLIRQGTPLITTTPYAYEAFRAVYQLDENKKWLDVLRKIAEHVRLDYHDLVTSEKASSCSYIPDDDDPCGVVNASAYRSHILMRAAADLGDDRYQQIAERNLQFVLETQNPDGSWYYSIDGDRDFVDHFHTCFVLKALAQIEQLSPSEGTTKAIERGIQYYVQNLFDEEGMPKPFSRRPRLTVYKRELYDYAECLNLCVLLKGRFPELDAIRRRLVHLGEWQKKDGSFRARQLYLGWDNTPMHRWAQSQMFRSLCAVLESEGTES